MSISVPKQYAPFKAQVNSIDPVPTKGSKHDEPFFT